jgi:hypothetical protein
MTTRSQDERHTLLDDQTPEENAEAEAFFEQLPEYEEGMTIAVSFPKGSRLPWKRKNLRKRTEAADRR